MRVRYMRVTRMRARLTGNIQKSRIEKETQVNSIENLSRVSYQCSSRVKSIVFISRNIGKDKQDLHAFVKNLYIIFKNK